MKIPFSPPYIDDDVINEVTESLRSGWITTGPKVKALEEEICKISGASRALGVNSWTSGAILVLRWLGLQPGDEVIVPAYTYSATALAVLWAGGKPVMVDSGDDFNISVEAIRHAITKMSHLHLTETEECRRRVIQLGEAPERVFNTGAIGIYNILHTHFLSREELETELATPIPEESLFVTFHPATLDAVPQNEQCANLLAALESRSDYKVFFSYPNNDTAGRIIIDMIEDYVRQNPERAYVRPSYGQIRYFSLMRFMKAAVGNSSSGIVEVPSLHIPTLNIGIRQNGRRRAASVVDCGVTLDEISRGLHRVLGADMQQLARTVQNPYEQPDTLQRIVDVVCNTPLEGITVKRFHDLF